MFLLKLFRPFKLSISRSGSTHFFDKNKLYKKNETGIDKKQNKLRTFLDWVLNIK